MRTMHDNESRRERGGGDLDHIAHELRTALTSIEGFSELIRDEALERAEVQEFAADINRNARRLCAAIEGLIDELRSAGTREQ